MANLSIIDGQGIQTLLPTGIQSALRIADISQEYRDLSIFSTPLLNIFMNNALPSEKAEFKHEEGDLLPAITTLSGDITDVATTIPLTDSNIGSVKGLFKILSTGEIFRAGSRGTGQFENCTRGIGSSSGTAATTGDVVLYLSTAFEESSTITDGVARNVTSVQNYTEIFQEMLEFSNTQIAEAQSNSQSRAVEGLKYAEMVRTKVSEFARNAEINAMEGLKSEDTSGTNVIRTTGGVREFVTTNVETIGSPYTWTEKQMSDWLMDYGWKVSNGVGNKILMGGTPLQKALNYWGLSRTSVPNLSQAIGARVSRYEFGIGYVDVIINDLWKPHYSGDELNQTLLVFDPTQFRARILRPTQLLEGVKTDQFDGLMSLIRGEWGWEIRNESTAAIANGFQGPTVS